MKLINFYQLIYIIVQITIEIADLLIYRTQKAFKGLQQFYNKKSNVHSKYFVINQISNVFVTNFVIKITTRFL